MPVLDGQFTINDYGAYKEWHDRECPQAPLLVNNQIVIGSEMWINKEHGVCEFMRNLYWNGMTFGVPARMLKEREVKLKQQP